MSSEFDHLKVHLEDIKSATNNFDAKKLIGRGAFGPVYKGELSLPQGQRTIMAFKRLDPKFGQGNDEFRKEIIMLSKYRHENLISLLCFCDEDHERILGYEYASRGSLDRYLGDTSLSWSQRIKICIGVARALSYLHDPNETQQRVFHRDIKSANILLDHNWTAKLSDFGLSKLGPTLQSHSYLISSPIGTPGYCDPLYVELGFLTKESDIYSFGVILFEVMCGRLCFESHGGELKFLGATWKNQYDENRLNDIVSYNLRRYIDSDSLMTFSAIAGRCLNRNRKERPTISEILKKLEIALNKQEYYSQNGINLLEFGNLAVPPLVYESQEKHLLLLMKGFRFQDTTWLSVDENKRVYEIISAVKCITIVGGEKALITREENSRFDNVMAGVHDFKIKARPEFLIPQVTYNINLIYKHGRWNHGTCLPFKYKLEEETETHYSGPFIAEMREDGWLVSQLYRFTCHQRRQHFTIDCFCGDSWNYMNPENFFLEGIEFRPVNHETEENNNMDSDVNWEQKFPNHYIDLIKLSKENIEWTTKKEAYSLLRQGFLVDDDNKWFSIDKNMKKRLMIHPESFMLGDLLRLTNIPKSRFEDVVKSTYKRFGVKCKIKSQLLSPQIIYSCHLIYKLPKNYSLHDSNILVKEATTFRQLLLDDPWCIYAMPPHTPIVEPNADENSPIPSYGRKIEGHPKLRKDGWMECQFMKVITTTNKTIKMHLMFQSLEAKTQNILSGIIVQGIEFRPM